MKKNLVAALAALGAGSVLAAGSSLDCIGNVTLKGRMGDQLDMMIRQHVIGTDIDYITAPFQEKTERHGWWQTEFWGKYMHSAVPYLKYTGSPARRWRASPPSSCSASPSRTWASTRRRSSRTSA